jgi:hypothetical protein
LVDGPIDYPSVERLRRERDCVERDCVEHRGLSPEKMLWIFRQREWRHDGIVFGRHSGEPALPFVKTSVLTKLCTNLTNLRRLYKAETVCTNLRRGDEYIQQRKEK